MRAQTHTHRRAHAYIYIYTYICVCIYTYIYIVCVCVCVCVCTPTISFPLKYIAPVKTGNVLHYLINLLKVIFKIGNLWFTSSCPEHYNNPLKMATC